MVVFHWLTAVLVVLAYLSSKSQAEDPSHSQFTHVVFGLSVLALTLSRMIVRLGAGVPIPLHSTHERLARLAELGHRGIYFLLLAVPVMGWFTLSRLGLKIELLGFRLPFLSAPVSGQPGLIATVHQIGGNLLLIVAATHAGVALWHHFWLRDQTLHRIWLHKGRAEASDGPESKVPACAQKPE